MQTRIPLTCAFVALSTLTAGCPSTNETPGAAKQAEQSAAKPTDDTTEALKHFGEIPYYVCDLGTHDTHTGFKGNHLNYNDVVQLQKSASGLKLKLGNKQIDVVASNGGKDLKGDSDFDHDPETSGPSQKLKHQVAVVKSTGYQKPEPPTPGCEPNVPNRPIIDIDFCPEKAGGGWDCKPPNMHQGDVHAQPSG